MLILGSVLVRIFIVDLYEGIVCTLCKFADGAVADTPEGRAAIQQELGRLSWVERNLVRFSKGSCRVLHPRRSNCISAS